MSKNVALANFTLDSVKKLKNGGLTISFETNEQVGDEIYNDKDMKESAKQPHPDLTNLLKELVPTVATVFGYTKLRGTVKSNAKVEAELEENYQGIIANLEVTGVSLSGTGNNKGVIITATMKAETNQKMALNTHRIRFNESRYGFEEELESLCLDIQTECHEYLFNGKKAQLELFDAPEPESIGLFKDAEKAETEKETAE